MTVNTPPTRLSYFGDDATVNFPITWKYIQKSHVVTTLRDANDVETTWVLDTDYTLTVAGVDAGGTLTATTAPATGETLIIDISVPHTQTFPLPLGGDFPSTTVEDISDLDVQRTSQLNTKFDRSLLVPISDIQSGADLLLPIDSARASMFLAFDANGKPIAAAGTSADLGPVSSFIDTLLDDSSDIVARATLKAAGLVVVNTFSEQQTWSKGADIASASPLVLGTDGNYFDVTGTTGFATITVIAGTLFMLQFDGALVLTHGATLDLPGEADITTRAGDRLIGFAEAADTVQVLSFSKAEGPAYPPGHLFGMELSNNALDATNDIDITVGSRRDAADTLNLISVAEAGKRLDATWVSGGTPGTALGGRASSQALANGTWHVFVGIVAGVVEYGFDTSVTAANLIADHSFSNIRRIGSIVRASAAILLFIQQEDDFWLVDVPLDSSVAVTATTSTITLSVPTGIRVNALVRAEIEENTSSFRMRLFATDLTDVAVTDNNAQFSNRANSAVGAWQVAGQIRVLANTSGQISARASVTLDVTKISTEGWKDSRGKDA